MKRVEFSQVSQFFSQNNNTTRNHFTFHTTELKLVLVLLSTTPSTSVTVSLTNLRKRIKSILMKNVATVRVVV